MKRKIIQLLSTCVCIVMIAGCTPMNDSQLTDNDSTEMIKENNEWRKEIDRLKSYKPANVPDHINIDISNSLLIDADISVSGSLEDYQVAGLKLKPHLFDVDNELEKILKLMGNPEVIKHERGVSDEVLPDEKTNLKFNTAYLTEKSFVQIRDSRVMIVALDNTPYAVSSSISGYYNNLFTVPGDTVGTLYKKDKELNFMKVEQAKNEAREFFEEAGADNICNLVCFSCDKESIQEEVNTVLADLEKSGMDKSEIPKIDKVTQKDEGYYIVAQQGYDGVPYLPIQADQSISNTYALYGTRMELLLTENGIIDSTIDGLFQVEEGEEKYEIMSVGDILDKFIALHNDNTSSVKIVAKNIGLYYLPILKDKENMSFDAYPVYCVIYDQPSVDNDDFLTREYNMYDAVTGEQMK